MGLSPVKWVFSRAKIFEFPQRVFSRGEGFFPGEEVFSRLFYVVVNRILVMCIVFLPTISKKCEALKRSDIRHVRLKKA